jgi:hypothetical protein
MGDEGLDCPDTWQEAGLPAFVVASSEPTVEEPLAVDEPVSAEERSPPSRLLPVVLIVAVILVASLLLVGFFLLKRQKRISGMGRQ